MIKSLKSATILASALSIAVLTLAIGGCGDATTTSATPDAAGVNGSSYAVSPGSYIRRSVSGDGKMSYTVTGIDMDLEKDNMPISYFYDSKGYGGGRTTGGFQGDLRNYKLKYYGSHGQIESEDYHGFVFRSSNSYNVVVEWKTGPEGYVRATVDGKVCDKPGAVSDSFTVGIGYPPAVRKGWDTAVYTNIVWPKGSTAVN